MTATPTQLSKLAIGPADPVTKFLNFADFDPGVTRELLDTNATRGTFDKDGNRVVTYRTRVNPRLSTQPTSQELADLLEWGMYGTVTGTTTKTYPLGDTPVLYNVYYAPKYGESWFMSGVAVDNLSIRAATGDALSIDLDLVGKTIDVSRTDFPGGLGPDQTTRPFVMSQLVLTVAGVARKCREFTWKVAHNIDRERFLNSATLTDLVKLDQSTMVSIDVPSGDNTLLWELGAAGVTLSAVFTGSGGGIFTLTFADLRLSPASPTWPNRGEGFLRLEGEAYRVGAGRPCTITLSVGA